MSMWSLSAASSMGVFEKDIHLNTADWSFNGVFHNLLCILKINTASQFLLFAFAA